MAKRQLAAQYVGSLLGFLWTFINPMVLIGVFWFVFSVGFKAQPVQNVPFVVWLTAGMAVWNLFADIVNRAPDSVISNANLIKKTIFPSQILPFVSIISSLITHIIFLLLLCILMLSYKMTFSWYFFQSLYYLMCMIILSLGLSWAAAALNVFVRDVGKIVAVVLQVGFWATPIFWHIDMMPSAYHSVLKLNPMFYIVQGYRDSFIDFVPFWEHGLLTVYFWCVALFIFMMGAFIFKELKPQFADVL
jgi:lipopolysaccharide transport system permease protein/teichoic acid transport system permease protein